MTTYLKPHLCVVGMGPGGFALAAAAAAARVDTTVVVRADRRDAGCPVAAKVAAAAARQAQAIRTSKRFGIDASDPDVDFGTVMRHARTVSARSAIERSPERLAAMGVRVLRADPIFADDRTLMAGGIEVRARHFVLALEPTPLVPPLPGIGSVNFLTQHTVYRLPRRPGRLIVAGNGAAGIELAQTFRRFGSEVTVVGPGAALAEFDPEMAEIVLRRVRAEGVRVLENARAVLVEGNARLGIRMAVEVENGPIDVEGTHLVVASGVVPDMERLDLQKAGVRQTGGSIRLNAAMRTSNRRIHAIGQVATGPQVSLQAGEQQALRLLRTLREGGRKAPAGPVVPEAMFTDPELAHVGLGEPEAMKEHKVVRVLRWPYADNDRAMAEFSTEGHAKVVTGAQGEILGVTIAGARAADLIGTWVLAMTHSLTIADVAAHVLPHPTFAEIGKRAALTYAGPPPSKPLVRRLFGRLGLFG